MKCVLCKMCDAARAAFNKQQAAWYEAQSNSVEIMERETDPAAIYQAYDLLKTDPAESLRQYLALAEQGSVWSMASVGQMFQSGIGTAKDLAKAEEWLDRAYRAGSDYGLIWLGMLYEGSEQYEKAQKVYRTGVARGFVPAMIHLATCYRNSPDWAQRKGEVLRQLECGSAKGDLFARHWLTSAMIRGWFGIQYIPEGIRRLPGVSQQMANLMKDETATSQGDNKSGPGFFNRLVAQLWLVGGRIQHARL
jgi:TPR repeat protein